MGGARIEIGGTIIGGAAVGGAIVGGAQRSVHLFSS